MDQDKDFERVEPTPDEMRAFHAKYGWTAKPRVYRVRCLIDGARFWGSGLGLGAHRRGKAGRTASAAR